MWWGCCKLKVFWSLVRCILQSIVEEKLPYVPSVMLICDFMGCKVGGSEVLLTKMLAVSAMWIASGNQQKYHRRKNGSVKQEIWG